MDNILGKPKPTKSAKKLRGRRRKKLSERQVLIRKLDLVTRSVVLARDGYCVCPPSNKGHSKVRQAGHIISRTRESVRWDLYNVHQQCSSCNMLHEWFPHRFVNQFLVNFGIEKYRQLCERAETVSKLQVYELYELIEQMNEIRAKVIQDKDFKPYFTQQEIMSGVWAEK
jgi:hypothetical protein